MIFVSLSGALIIVVIVVGVAIAAVTFVVDIKERKIEFTCYSPKNTY